MRARPGRDDDDDDSAEEQESDGSEGARRGVKEHHVMSDGAENGDDGGALAAALEIGEGVWSEDEEHEGDDDDDDDEGGSSELESDEEELEGDSDDGAQEGPDAGALGVDTAAADGDANRRARSGDASTSARVASADGVRGGQQPQAESLKQLKQRLAEGQAAQASDASGAQAAATASEMDAAQPIEYSRVFTQEDFIRIRKLKVRSCCIPCCPNHNPALASTQLQVKCVCFVRAASGARASAHLSTPCRSSKRSRRRWRSTG